MIDGAGTVVGANAPAQALLAAMTVTLRANAPAVPLLRALRAEAGAGPARTPAALRRSLGRRQPAVFELRREDHTVQAELHPVAGGPLGRDAGGCQHPQGHRGPRRRDGAARSPHRPPEPAAPARAPRRGPRAPAAHRRGLRPAAGRSRPVQAGQRHAGPPGRRRAAGEGGGPPALDGAAHRHGGADRRRRVRHPAGRDPRRGGHAGARPPHRRSDRPDLHGRGPSPDDRRQRRRGAGTGGRGRCRHGS